VWLHEPRNVAEYLKTVKKTECEKQGVQKTGDRRDADWLNDLKKF